MCGIAGVLRVHRGGEAPPVEASIPARWLKALDAGVRHRGPDGVGRFRDRVVRTDGAVVDVALVHRRLAIIDPAGGAQPMAMGCAPAVGGRALGRCAGCGDGARLAVALNGCVYNHRDLRAGLERAGHAFSTDHSDTEALVHGWGALGAGVLERAEGMFAALVWDGAAGTLWAVRDRFGEKPLYGWWDEAGDLVVLASTASAVLRWMAAAGERIELDEDACGGWLRLGWGVGATPVRRCREVEAGSVLEARGTEPVRVRRWEPAATARGFESEEEVGEALCKAVGGRLEADVPVGVFLSGGVDSSLVALYASRAAGRVTTLTVRMPDARYDESRYARMVAERIGSVHVELEGRGRPVEEVERLVGEVGLPFADSSLVASAWVSRAARGCVGVVLTGDGGDELFCGYERQVVAGALRGLRALGPLARVAARVPMPSRDPKSSWSKAGRLMQAVAGVGYEDLVAVFPASMVGRVWRGGMGEVGAGSGRRYDVERYLPGDLMRKSDTASMSVALEARAPFLAPSVADPALATPERRLMAGGRKGMLRALARRVLPAQVVDRPKMGFAVPVGAWFRPGGEMRGFLLEALEDPAGFGPVWLGLVDLIDRDGVRALVREHDWAGEPSVWPWRGRDHGQRLYALAVLAAWGRWVGGLSVPGG